MKKTLQAFLALSMFILTVTSICPAYERSTTDGTDCTEIYGFDPFELYWSPAQFDDGGYYINANCVDTNALPAGSQITAIQNAAASWNSTGSNFTFTYAGTTTILPTTSPSPSEDNNNVIGWNPTIDGSGDPFAIAWVFFYCENGLVTEADIELDESKNWSTGASVPGTDFDVETVALHEMGHALGLDHTTESAAVMWATLATGDSKRVLHGDDIDGQIAIYGGTAVQEWSGLY